MAVLLLLCLTTTASKCDNKVHEARKAAYRIQVVIDGTIDSVDKLNLKGVISNGDALVVAKLLKNINAANGVLIKKAAEAKEDTPIVRLELLDLFKNVSTAVAFLRQHRIINIKDAEVAAALDGALAALDISLAAIELALGED